MAQTVCGSEIVKVVDESSFYEVSEVVTGKFSEQRLHSDSLLKLVLVWLTEHAHDCMPFYLNAVLKKYSHRKGRKKSNKIVFIHISIYPDLAPMNQLFSRAFSFHSLNLRSIESVNEHRLKIKACLPSAATAWCHVPLGTKLVDVWHTYNVISWCLRVIVAVDMTWIIRTVVRRMQLG